MPDSVDVARTPADSKTPDVGGIAAAQLRSLVERIERLEEEKAGLGKDIADIFQEAKGNGYDIRILKTIIRLRKMDDADRQEQDSLLDLYMQALGMLPPS
jgi:uncharacterized protein (UPF0335 family)